MRSSADVAAAAAAATATGGALRLRVVSYNVLSSHLAQPSHFSSLPPEHLKASNRLPVILQKLQAEIDQQQHRNTNASARSVIFCLQEVSYDWAGEFHTFFSNRGFHMVTGLYGKKFNGYMGVCLAWPTASLETLAVDISRLSDQREKCVEQSGGDCGWPVPPEPNEWERSSLWFQARTKIWNPLASHVQESIMALVQQPIFRYILGTADATTEPPTDHWAVAQNRMNVMLTATLREKESGRSFLVSTYHMPCAYYAPMIMTIHVDLAVRHVQNLAAAAAATTTTTTNDHQPKEKLPYILAGDFNIKPVDSTYRLITTGQMDRTDPCYPTPKYGYEWMPSMREPMQSAYAMLAHEPDFTNYARVGDLENECFIDTLDYIWLSPSSWKVDSIAELPQRQDAKGPFPNLDVNEASDHVLIAADLTLPERV